MKRDEYHLHVRNDSLLMIQFGTLEMQKRKKDRYNDISYTLRCIAKLIMEFKSVSGQEDVFGKDLIFPKTSLKLSKTFPTIKVHGKLRNRTEY